MIVTLEFPKYISPYEIKTGYAMTDLSSKVHIGGAWKEVGYTFETDSDIMELVQTLAHENIHVILDRWSNGKWDSTYGQNDFDHLLKLTTQRDFLLTNGSHYGFAKLFTFENPQKLREFKVDKARGFQGW